MFTTPRSLLICALIVVLYKGGVTLYERTYPEPPKKPRLSTVPTLKSSRPLPDAYKPRDIPKSWQIKLPPREPWQVRDAEAHSPEMFKKYVLIQQYCVKCHQKILEEQGIDTWNDWERKVDALGTVTYERRKR